MPHVNGFGFVFKNTPDKSCNTVACTQLPNMIVDCRITDGPSNNAASTQLPNMIEDCLVEIFSKNLDLIDLCSVAETCKRFRSIAPRVFGEKIAISGLGSYTFSFFRPFHYHYTTNKRSDVERIFENFGSCFYSVCIFGPKWRFVLDLVEKHYDEQLKILDIHHLYIPSALAHKLKPVFRRLQSLSLLFVSIERNEPVVKELSSLIRLRVIWVDNCETILANVFPKLEEFTFESRNEILNQSSPALTTFITRHMTLKSLVITLCLDKNGWIPILKAIGNSCMKLEKLTIDNYTPGRSCPSLTPLHALKSLGDVFLHDMTFENFNGLVHLNTLQALTLYKSIPPRDVDQFACLSQLAALSLVKCKLFGAFDVIDIIERLINLKKLQLQFSTFDGRKFVLDERISSKIEYTVKDRSNALTVECLCDHSEYCLNTVSYSTRKT